MGETSINSKKKLLTSGRSKAANSAKKGPTQTKTERRKCRRILSAILTRVLFGIHSGIAIWRVSVTYPVTYIYFLSIGLVLLAVEMIFTIIVRKGKEYKWFCPSVLFYLMSVVPSLWLLEINRFNGAMVRGTRAGICNVTVQSHKNSAEFLSLIFVPPEVNSTGENRSKRQAIETGQLYNSELFSEQSNNFMKLVKREVLSDLSAKRGRKRKKKRKRMTTTPIPPLIPNAVDSTKYVSNASHGTESMTQLTVVTSSAMKSAPNITIIQTKIKESNETTTNSLSLPHQNTSTASIVDGEIKLTADQDMKVVSSPSPPVKTTVGFFDFPTSRPLFPTTSSLSSHANLLTTTSATDATKVTTSLTTKKHDESIRLDNLGEKINEGFSSIKQQTANLLNSTKQVIEQLDRTIDLETWILLLHQVLLFVLVIGRWLLPKGEITRDQLSQLLLVFIGVGADILEFVTETIDGDELNVTSCVMILHVIIYTVWSWSLLQFTLVLTASKSRKTRVGFENELTVDREQNGCCGNSIFASADLWGILVTLFLQDVPFLATRLYILVVYDLKHQMMIFFTGKNALVVILQVYRIIVLKMKRDRHQDDDIDQSEMEPLRGTLTQLARRATVATETGVGEDIRDATFKRQHDGSVVVKIHLEGEETLKRKRKKTSNA